MSEHKSAEQRFEVGEVAIFSRPGSRFDGIEVSITEALHFALVRDQRTDRSAYGYVYSIEGDFGPKRPGVTHWVAPPADLRKKRPPQDWVKLCRLDEIPAQSEGVPA
jgi:hypothetical protein